MYFGLNDQYPWEINEQQYPILKKNREQQIYISFNTSLLGVHDYSSLIKRVRASFLYMNHWETVKLKNKTISCALCSHCSKTTNKQQKITCQVKSKPCICLDCIYIYTVYIYIYIYKKSIQEICWLHIHACVWWGCHLLILN